MNLSQKEWDMLDNVLEKARRKYVCGRDPEVAEHNLKLINKAAIEFAMRRTE
jgi:hypothetical protein